MISILRWLFVAHKMRIFAMAVMFAVVVMMISLIDQIVFNIDNQIELQTKPIVWADLIIEDNQPLDTKMLWFLRDMDDVDLVTEYVEFYTTLVTNTDPMLFKLQAIQDPYPLYGILKVHDIAWNGFISNPADYLSWKQWVYLDAESYKLLWNPITIDVWSLTLDVLGIIQEQANLGFNFLDEGRTVMIHNDLVKSTQLMDYWSRIEYQLQIKVSQSIDISDIELITTRIKEQFGNDIRIIAAQERIWQLWSLINQFNQYISIITIAMVLLVLAAMNIAISTMATIIRSTIAIMRVLGMTKKQVIIILSLVWLSSFIIGLVWWWIWSYVLFQYVTQLEVAQDFIRINKIFRRVILVSILSFLICTLPSIITLVRTWPLELLQQHQISFSWMYKYFLLLWYMFGIIAILLVLTGDVFFSALVVVFFVIVAFVFHTLLYYLFNIWTSIAKQRRSSNFLIFDALRQTILPGNQTSLLVGSLLVALISFAVLLSVSWSFIDRLRISWIDQPNLFILNVKSIDLDNYREYDPSVKLYDNIATRIFAINGESLDTYLDNRFGDSGQQSEFTREFNVTTAALINSPILRGDILQTWWVSLDESFAQRLELNIGDRLTLLIQWRYFDQIVTSLRKRISTGSEPFFYMQLDAQEFSLAPRSWFAVTRVEDLWAYKSWLINLLWNHLSFIDIAQIIKLITDISYQIITVIVACVMLIIILIMCVSIASNESSASLSRQSYQLYYILWMTKNQLIQKSFFIIAAYSAMIIIVLIILLPLLLSYIYSQAVLLTWSWTSFYIIITIVVLSIVITMWSYMFFHTSIIKKV